MQTVYHETLTVGRTLVVVTMAFLWSDFVPEGVFSLVEAQASKQEEFKYVKFSYQMEKVTKFSK